MVPKFPAQKDLNHYQIQTTKSGQDQVINANVVFLRLFIFIFVDIDDYHNVFCETIIPWLIAFDRKVNYVYY